MEMQSTVCRDSFDESVTPTTTTRKSTSSPTSPLSVEMLRSASQSPPATVSADGIPSSADIQQPLPKPSLPTKSAGASSTDFSISSILSRQTPVRSSRSPPPQSTAADITRPQSRDPYVDVVTTSGGRKDDDDVKGFDVGSGEPVQRRVRAESGGVVADSDLSAALRQLLERQLVGPTATAAVAAAAASGSPWYPTWLQSALLHRRIAQTSSTDGSCFSL